MRTMKDGLKTCLLLAVFTILAYMYVHLLKDTINLASIYILCVFLVARFTSGYAWGIVASIIGMLGVNFFFVRPQFAFNFTMTGYPITFISMVVIAIVTTTLTASLQERIKIKTEQEARPKIMNEMNRNLIVATSFAEIVQPVLNDMREFSNISCIFYSEDPLTDKNPLLSLVNPQDEHLFFNPVERDIAHLAYASIKTGNTLNVDSTSKCYYIPVVNNDTIWGMVALLATKDSTIIKENVELFKLLVPQLILTFEHNALMIEHQKLAIESEKEKMRANLLRAVSHDLRTPLTSMIGSSSAYLENNETLSEEEKIKFVSQIKEDATWLLNMVENLLSVTRIITDTTKIVKKEELLEEIIGESVVRVKRRFPNAPIKVTLPDDVILVPVDATLIEQVIINLIENAIKHAETFTHIDVNSKANNTHAIIEVMDDGIGIAPERLDTLFDGYGLYKKNESPDSSKGMGIGLSICKTIVVAHEGTLTVRNLPKGTAFTLTLPMH